MNPNHVKCPTGSGLQPLLKETTPGSEDRLLALVEVWTLQKTLLCVSGEEELGNAVAPAIKGTSIGPLLHLGVLSRQLTLWKPMVGDC